MTLRIIFIVSVLFAITFGQSCSSTLEWTTGKGQIWVNDLPYNLKGINWDGFSTTQGAWSGLNYHPYKDILSWLQKNGFNTIRLMFHLDLVTQDQQPQQGQIDYNKNPDLKGLTSMEILQKVVVAGADYGISFMLDMHSFSPYIWNKYDSGLWYDSTHSEADVLHCWDLLMQRFKSQWNIIGMDLINEPYNTTWGTGNISSDWNLAVQRIANHIHATGGPSYLIFVEGNWDSPVCKDNCYWGEDLTGVHTHPIVINHQNKLLYSAHSYGPPGQVYFNTSNFPNNMPGIWEDHYGFIPAATGVPIMVGEFRLGGWGDPPTEWQRQWFNTFIDWAISKNIPLFYFVLEFETDGSFYPGSDVLALLEKAQPHATRISTHNGQFCITNP